MLINLHLTIKLIVTLVTLTHRAKEKVEGAQLTLAHPTFFKYSRRERANLGDEIARKKTSLIHFLYKFIHPSHFAVCLFIKCIIVYTYVFQIQTLHFPPSEVCTLSWKKLTEEFALKQETHNCKVHKKRNH